MISKGHVFKNSSDSEVILHGYEEYGESILQKLRGMFAFVIWDIKDESLFFARDIFGSEIKAFMKQPVFIKELNKEALKPYLTFQYSVMDETFFKGVYKLKPAHYMIFKKGETTIKPYWHLNFDPKENSLEH